MMQNAKFTLCIAPCRGDKSNAVYPKTILIEDINTLVKATTFDHVCAEFNSDHRSAKDFITSDCLPMDLDNESTENPAEWITPDDVSLAFPGVRFYSVTSRNYMKPKDGKAPRPKYHFYFPIDSVTDAKDYAAMKRKMWELLPAFDENALDAARFFFGNESPEVAFYDGDMNLTEFLNKVKVYSPKAIEPLAGKVKERDTSNPAAKSANGTPAITKGERNSTLSRKAGQLLKRYGDTEETRRTFDEWAAKCRPQLEQGELDAIYKSAQGFLHNTIEKQPGYKKPAEYAAQDFTNIWALPIKNPKAMAAICAGDPKHRKFGIVVARTFMRAFGVIIKINEMNKRAEIEGLPKEYSGEDAPNLLPTLISDIANALAFKRASSLVINEVLGVIASENRYHPVMDLLNARPWDKTDRLPEVYRILGLADDFHKTLVKKWAMQTIAVLYNTTDTPISAQGVLVLQGTQGIGKTEFFRHLAILEKFFKGGAQLDTSNKDTLMSATKVWICELGEIDSTTKKEQSSLKAFLTEAKDSFREPYARSETIRPRRTAFCGTVNPKGYLRDETGNRRYWTIPVTAIDINAIFAYPPEWYAQFWRQIHAEYKTNPKGHLLTKSEQDRVNSNNTEFEAEIYGEDEFITAFNMEADKSAWKWQTAAQIAGTLNDKYKGLNIRSEGVGGRLLPRIEKRMGMVFERKTNRGRRLILCPPKAASEFQNDNKDDEDEPFFGIPPLTGKEGVGYA